MKLVKKKKNQIIPFLSKIIFFNKVNIKHMTFSEIFNPLFHSAHKESFKYNVNLVVRSNSNLSTKEKC